MRHKIFANAPKKQMDVPGDFVKFSGVDDAQGANQSDVPQYVQFVQLYFGQIGHLFYYPSLISQIFQKCHLISEGICPMNQFRCTNDTCIPISWACDGVDDCGDNTDENKITCVTGIIY